LAKPLELSEVLLSVAVSNTELPALIEVVHGLVPSTQVLVDGVKNTAEVDRARS